MAGKRTFTPYTGDMTEDPRYLRNESRAAHRGHGRTRRMLRWTVVFWLILAAAFTAAAAADVLLNLGWGYEARDVWGGLLMMAFGCGFWLFATFINHVVLAYSRRLFGPEPTGPAES